MAADPDTHGSATAFTPGEVPPAGMKPHGHSFRLARMRPLPQGRRS
jgi:hypothetical protein